MEENSQYKIGQIIVHKREGIAKIIDVKTIGEQKFFLVRTKNGEGDNIYIPLNKVNEIVRPLMNIKQADEILKFMNDLVLSYNPNTKKRRDDFKKRFNSGNIYDIVFLCKQLFSYKNNEALQAQIKFGPMDFLLLENAERILFDELCLCYQVDKNNILAFIKDRIQSLSL